jgi:two-component system LytT family response regulator
VAAFERGATDYLLKPFRRERLTGALARVRARIRERTAQVADIPPLAGEMMAMQDVSRPLERLFVRDRGLIVPVAVADVERIDADGDYSTVMTATRRFLVAVPLVTLHERINHADFGRVHRAHVVNLAQVARIVPGGDGRLMIELRETGKVIASRAGSQALRETVG